MSNDEQVGLWETTAEELRSLAYARRNWLPRNNDKVVSPATAYRWVKKGVCGVPLRVLFTSAGCVTSEEACKDFIRNVDAARRVEMTPAIDATDEQLRAAKLLLNASDTPIALPSTQQSPVRRRSQVPSECDHRPP
ncbi:MAG: hypothetical protein ABGZ53_32725 [Fuerstiella sp.]